MVGVWEERGQRKVRNRTYADIDFLSQEFPDLPSARQHQLVIENLHVDGSRSTTGIGQPRGRLKRWQAKAPNISALNSLQPDIKGRLTLDPLSSSVPPSSLNIFPVAYPQQTGSKEWNQQSHAFLSHVSCFHPTELSDAFGGEGGGS